MELEIYGSCLNWASSEIFPQAMSEMVWLGQGQFSSLTSNPSHTYIAEVMAL